MATPGQLPAMQNTESFNVSTRKMREQESVPVHIAFVGEAMPALVVALVNRRAHAKMTSHCLPFPTAFRSCSTCCRRSIV